MNPWMLTLDLGLEVVKRVVKGTLPIGNHIYIRVCVEMCCI